MKDFNDVNLYKGEESYKYVVNNYLVKKSTGVREQVANLFNLYGEPFLAKYNADKDMAGSIGVFFDGLGNNAYYKKIVGNWDKLAKETGSNTMKTAIDAKSDFLNNIYYTIYKGLGRVYPQYEIGNVLFTAKKKSDIPVLNISEVNINDFRIEIVFNSTYVEDGVVKALDANNLVTGANIGAFTSAFKDSKVDIVHCYLSNKIDGISLRINTNSNFSKLKDYLLYGASDLSEFKEQFDPYKILEGVNTDSNKLKVMDVQKYVYNKPTNKDFMEANVPFLFITSRDANKLERLKTSLDYQIKNWGVKVNVLEVSGEDSWLNMQSYINQNAKDGEATLVISHSIKNLSINYNENSQAYYQELPITNFSLDVFAISPLI